MARNSTYRHYSLDQSTRQTASVTSFKGVDFSSQKFLVNSARAIDAQNYVYRDGVLQKRFGYDQLVKIPEIKYIAQPFDSNAITSGRVKVNTTHFNGIWSFLAEDGKTHTIAHVGKLLFEVDMDTFTFKEITTGTATSTEDSLTYVAAYEYEDYRSFAFVGSNRLWFLGGNKYMCVRYPLTSSTVEVAPVDSMSDTFIPTTTIGITYKNALVSGRAGLDYTNLLTYWRKNLCLSGIGKGEDNKTKTDFYEYTFDSPLLTKNETVDMANLEIIIEERGSTDE